MEDFDTTAQGSKPQVSGEVSRCAENCSGLRLNKPPVILQISFHRNRPSIRMASIQWICSWAMSVNQLP